MNYGNERHREGWAGPAMPREVWETDGDGGRETETEERLDVGDAGRDGWAG